MQNKYRLAIGATMVVGIFGMLGTAAALPIPHPTVIHVTTNSFASNPNDGKCSLQEAMQSAFNQDNKPVNECAGTPGPTLIDFLVAGTIVVPDQMPYIHNDVYIMGPIILDGNNDPFPVTNIVSSGTLTLTNLTMRNAGYSYIRNMQGKLYVAGVSFEGNNSGGGGGGAILNEGGELYIAGASFLNNKAVFGTRGGAINSTGASIVKIAGAAFTGNSAGSSGGAVAFGGGHLDIGDTAFTANVVDGGGFLGGGALEMYSTSNSEPITLTRTAFTANVATSGKGGAIWSHGDSGVTVTIKDSSFQGNIAAGVTVSATGGAISNYDNPLVIQRSTFFLNNSLDDGGAIESEHDSRVILGSVSFSSNSAGNRGGALMLPNVTDGLAVQAINVTMDANTASLGGAIYNSESQYDVISMTNSIVADNLPQNCVDNDASSFPVHTAGHNIQDDLSCFAAAGSDLNTNPFLELPGIHGGPISTLTVQRPVAGSPAVDSGDNATCANGWVENKDVRGGDRPVDGNDDGVKICDRGAFENDKLNSKFDSFPAPNATIDFGNGLANVAIPFTGLKVRNDGDAALLISGVSVIGPNATDFSVPGVPSPLAPHSLFQTVTNMVCTPKAVGLRTATLTFNTTDSNNATVSYNLMCEGVAAPTAGFASLPAAPGPLSASTQQGAPKAIPLSLIETGNTALMLSNPVLTSNPVGAMALGAIPGQIADGAAQVNTSVTCNATTAGLATGSLGLDTNDPANPHVSFTVICDVAKIPDAPMSAGAAAGFGNGSSASNNGPYGIAISPDGNNVYATDDGDSILNVFKRNVDNTLSLIETDSLAGGAKIGATIQVMVSPDGRNVYVTGLTGNGIASYARNAATGQLILQSTAHNNDSEFCFFCTLNVQGLGGAYGMALSPGGDLIYVSSVYSHSVDVFRRSQISTSFGSLSSFLGPSQVQHFVDANLSQAYGIAASPDGTNLYATSYDNSKLLVLKRNAISGVLSTIQTLTTADASGLNGVFRVTVSDDGKNVYTASYNGSAVCVFSRAQLDGKLIANACHTNGFGGITNMTSATDVALSPDGMHLFATAFGGKSVTVFERDPATGNLQFAQSIVRGDVGAGLPALDGARGVVVSPQGDAIYVTAHTDEKIVMIPFAHPKPVANAVFPASKVQSTSAFSVSVQGEGFIPASKIRWNGVDHATLFVNVNEVRATISVADQATLGAIPVTVFNPAPGGGTSAALNVTMFAPPPPPNTPNPPPLPLPIPALGQISPLGIPAGSAALQLKLVGTDFSGGATALWNGTSRPIMRINNQLAYLNLSAGDLTQAGLNTVQIFNQLPVLARGEELDLVGNASNTQVFEVTAINQNPIPSIDTLSPNNSRVGQVKGQLVVIINGANFLPSSQAHWNGTNKPTQYVSKTQLKMTISAGDLVLPGFGSVSVSTSTPGGGDSNIAAFSIASAFSAAPQAYLPMLKR